jgi:hypothetical protein
VRAEKRVSAVNHRGGGRLEPAIVMDFLLFNEVSLLPDSGLGHLCEDLNSVVGLIMSGTNRVRFLTSELLTSRHDCVSDLFAVCRLLCMGLLSICDCVC